MVELRRRAPSCEEGDLPPRTPHASTCVAFGDWAATEANAPDLSDSARQTKREQAPKAYQAAREH